MLVLHAPDYNNEETPVLHALNYKRKFLFCMLQIIGRKFIYCMLEIIRRSKVPVLHAPDYGGKFLYCMLWIIGGKFLYCMLQIIIMRTLLYCML
jgi:hypothetical protein